MSQVTASCFFLVHASTKYKTQTMPWKKVPSLGDLHLQTLLTIETKESCWRVFGSTSLRPRSNNVVNHLIFRNAATYLPEKTFPKTRNISIPPSLKTSPGPSATGRNGSCSSSQAPALSFHLRWFFHKDPPPSISQDLLGWFPVPYLRGKHRIRILAS